MYKIWLLRAKHKSTFILQYTNSYSLYAKETNISHYVIFSKYNILLLYVSFINDNNYNKVYILLDSIFMCQKKESQCQWFYTVYSCNSRIFSIIWIFLQNNKYNNKRFYGINDISICILLCNICHSLYI